MEHRKDKELVQSTQLVRDRARMEVQEFLLTSEPRRSFSHYPGGREGTTAPDPLRTDLGRGEGGGS